MDAVTLFPGQGSQAPGMGQFLFDNFRTAKECFEEASDTLSVDFKKLCFEGPEAELARTENTQPALLLVSTSYFRCLNEILSLTPIVAAGHSVGEYAALVSAGALQFSDALRAVRLRGQAMQGAVPEGLGGMTALMGLEPEQVIELCTWVETQTQETPIEPANYNCPGQIVISGKKTLLDWAEQNFNPEIFASPPRRVKFIPLKVSAPFHCSMMKPAEDKMRNVLSEIKFSKAPYPIVQNFVAEAQTDPEDLRHNLVAQVSAPVRWIETIEKIHSLHPKALHIELGHGKVLSGLNKKIHGDITTYNINSLEELKTLEKQWN